MGVLDCMQNKMTATDSTEVFPDDAYTIGGSRRDLESQSKPNPVARTHSVWWNVFTDVPLLVLLLVLTLLFELNIIPSHKAGFICNDPKLGYPYTGDTITATALVVPILFLPIAVILTTELVLLGSEGGRSRTLEAIKKTCLLFRSYVYGLFFHVLIIEVMKGITGMPRPTFFDLCAPDTAFNCTAGEYISTFECTSSFSSWLQHDSYHSFPSGHSSCSVYCGLFLAWYLQRRAFSWSLRSVLLVPILQLVCLSFAAVCSLTRITDYRHHWWDVAVGAIIGASAAGFSVLCLSGNFSLKRVDQENSKTHEPTNLYGDHRIRPSS